MTAPSHRRDGSAPLASISHNITATTTTAYHKRTTFDACFLNRPTKPAVAMVDFAQEDRIPNGAPTETDTASQDELDLTSLENDVTDTLDRQMLQHARDQQRLQALSRGDSGARLQAFRKARPGTRVGLTLENLERQNGQDGRDRRFGSPASVSSSERSEPPVQGIPHEWGRKGRKNNDWLKTIQINGAEEQYEEADNTHPAGASSRHDENARDADRSAANVPLPSVEDSPEVLRRSHASPGNSSLERIRQWELSEDLTLGSVLASTPAALTRNTALDEIRQRELEGLRTRRITSNELASIREKSPFESPSQRSASRSSLRPRSRRESAARDDGITSDWVNNTDDQHINLPKRQSSLRSPLKLPSLIRRVSSSGVDQEAPTSPPAVNTSNVQGHTSPQRPSQKRQDSQDLLRRLARATSNSPSPQLTRQRPVTERPTSPSKMSKIPTFAKRSGTEEQRPSSAFGRPISSLGQVRDESSNESVIKRSNKGKTVVLDTPEVNGERSKTSNDLSPPKRASLIPTPDKSDSSADRRRGRMSYIPQRITEDPIVADARKQIVEEHCETGVGPSSPTRTPNAAKTPKVTAGGWIDTPVTATHRKSLPLWANNSRLGSRSRSRSPKKGGSRPSSPDKPASRPASPTKPASRPASPTKLTSRPASPSKLSKQVEQHAESHSRRALDAIAEPVNLPKPILPKSALSAVLAQEA
ncbi:hypothetical protein LTS18_006465, partial [Coniosporium uncinatum]